MWSLSPADGPCVRRKWGHMALEARDWVSPQCVYGEPLRCKKWGSVCWCKAEGFFLCSELSCAAQTVETLCFPAVIFNPSKTGVCLSLCRGVCPTSPSAGEAAQKPRCVGFPLWFTLCRWWAPRRRSTDLTRQWLNRQRKVWQLVKQLSGGCWGEIGGVLRGSRGGWGSGGRGWVGGEGVLSSAFLCPKEKCHHLRFPRKLLFWHDLKRQTTLSRLVRREWLH